MLVVYDDRSNGDDSSGGWCGDDGGGDDTGQPFSMTNLRSSSFPAAAAKWRMVLLVASSAWMVAPWCSSTATVFISAKVAAFCSGVR